MDEPMERVVAPDSGQKKDGDPDLARSERSSIPLPEAIKGSVTLPETTRLLPSIIKNEPVQIPDAKLFLADYKRLVELGQSASFFEGKESSGGVDKKHAATFRAEYQRQKIAVENVLEGLSDSDKKTFLKSVRSLYVESIDTGVHNLLKSEIARRIPLDENDKLLASALHSSLAAKTLDDAYGLLLKEAEIVVEPLDIKIDNSADTLFDDDPFSDGTEKAEIKTTEPEPLVIRGQSARIILLAEERLAKGYKHLESFQKTLVDEVFSTLNNKERGEFIGLLKERLYEYNTQRKISLADQSRLKSPERSSLFSKEFGFDGSEETIDRFRPAIAQLAHLRGVAVFKPKSESSDLLVEFEMKENRRKEMAEVEARIKKGLPAVDPEKSKEEKPETNTESERYSKSVIAALDSSIKILETHGLNGVQERISKLIGEGYASANPLPDALNNHRLIKADVKSANEAALSTLLKKVDKNVISEKLTFLSERESSWSFNEADLKWVNAQEKSLSLFKELLSKK